MFINSTLQNDEGVLMFRACPYGIETEEILLSPAALMSAAYYAKVPPAPHVMRVATSTVIVAEVP